MIINNRTYCDYCQKPRHEDGQDGYYDGDDFFIHIYCIWNLYKDEIKRKVKKLTRKMI